MAGWIAIVLGGAAVACSGDDKSPGTSPESDGVSGAPPAAHGRESWAGSETSPEFPAGLTWFNVEQPPTLASLRGKIILIDFWTTGCINCQHIIPDLKQLEEEFREELVVIGVHSGKYTTEHEDDGIREAIGRYGLKHPVVNDPDFVFWRTFGANAWPTLVLIDPAGNLVGGHAGEGVYPLFQPIIRSLAYEFRDTLNRAPLALKQDVMTASTVLSYPGDVLADEAGGRLFIVDSGHNRILVAALDGTLRQAIGSGKEGFADGAATEAEFRQPQGVALSADGHTLYVADTRNHAIRAVDLATGQVRTIAGTGVQLDRLPSDGSPAATTAMASPWDVLVRDSILYISMAGIHQLWAMDLQAGTVSVYAGTSREGISDGDRRSMATLAQPSGLASDGKFLYWVDPEASAVRRVLFADNSQVETLVGTGLFEWGDRDGTGRAAQLQHPQGIAFGAGSLYIADTYNQRLKAMGLANAQVTTLAGTGERGWTDGDAHEAEFDEPGGMSVAGGQLYVADANNHLVRVMDLSSKQVSTLRLTNLAAAGPPAAGQVRRVQLPGATVAPGTSTLRLVVETPAGLKLNSQAPSRLELRSLNPSVAELGESDVSWSSDDPRIEAPVPALLREGSTTVVATGAVYYCREGAEALCFIEQVEVSLPLTVSGSSTAGEAVLRIVLAPATDP